MSFQPSNSTQHFSRLVFSVVHHFSQGYSCLELPLNPPIWPKFRGRPIWWWISAQGFPRCWNRVASYPFLLSNRFVCGQNSCGCYYKAYEWDFRVAFNHRFLIFTARIAKTTSYFHWSSSFRAAMCLYRKFNLIIADLRYFIVCCDLQNAPKVLRFVPLMLILDSRAVYAHRNAQHCS